MTNTINKEIMTQGKPTAITAKKSPITLMLRSTSPASTTLSTQLSDTTLMVRDTELAASLETSEAADTLQFILARMEQMNQETFKRLADLTASQ